MRSPRCFPSVLVLFTGLTLATSLLARPSPFSRVPLDHWSYADLETVFQGDRVEGYDEPFHGGTALSREQLARVLREALRQAPRPAELPLAERARLRKLAREYAHELSMLDTAAPLRAAWLGEDAPAAASPPAAFVPAAAPPSPASPPPPPPEPAKPRIQSDSRLKFSGQVRVRPEYNDNYDFNDRAGDSRDFTLLRTTMGVHFDRGDRYEAFIQLRDSRTFGGERTGAGGIPGNTAANQGNVDLHQGYVDYYPRGKDRWRFRLGRQEINWGDQRLVGALDWHNVGRSFDGLRATGPAGDTELDTFYLVIGDRTLGATGVTGPDDQILAGAKAKWTLDAHTLETYLLHFEDDAALNARSQAGVAGPQSWETFGVRALGPLGGSRLDYKLETAIQRGDFSTDDLSAEALALILGYDLDNDRDRLELEWNYSPGDEGRAGTRGTWQTLFPTNHMHYGIADRVAWQNIRAVRATWKRKLGGARNFRADVWKFDLDDSRDAWYGAAGGPLRAASPGAPRDLGWELDLRYTWKDRAMKHQIGLAKFFGGDFQAATSAAGRSDDATFAYWMMIFPL